MANKKPAAKAAPKRSNKWIVAAAAVLVCLAIVAARGGKTTGEDADGTAESSERQIEIEEATVVASGAFLNIPTADITTDASFYPVEVDGTRMEIIAVRDSTGQIRTAFNTCQVCYGSSRAYYEQSGDYLVCQNCGNRFSMDQVEIESGGCNPWPIFEDDKIVTDDMISISYDFLVESKEIFANWRTNY